VNFDSLFARKYHPKDCNCFDLVADFYKLNLNVDLREALPAFTGKRTYRAQRNAFHELAEPKDLCLCVFKPYNTAIETSHVGIYWRDEVFHIDEDGVRFSSLQYMALCFASVRYYEYKRPDH
jgi:hypothetical protein